MQAFLAGGARASYFVPVLSKDFPSDHSRMDVVFFRATARRRRTGPRTSGLPDAGRGCRGSLCSLLEALDEIAHISYAILPEVKLSRVPPRVSAFAWGSLDHGGILATTFAFLTGLLTSLPILRRSWPPTAPSPATPTRNTLQRECAGFVARRPSRILVPS